MTLQPPIIIVGATRSGTTMLMRVLGSAPGLCFWHEPQTLWRVGHAYRDHDCAGAADARPWVRRWIRRQFFKYQEHHGGLRVVEKSPTNVLRIPFVRKIFPEARIIHIYRDGRANLRSQVEQYHTFAGYKVINREGGRHILPRLEETPFWEWPAYMPRAAAGLVRRYVTRRPGVRWFGVKYPGWRHDLRTMTTAQIAAKQWVISVETAMRDLAEVPPDRRGVVSGLLRLSRNLGLITGASAMGAVFTFASATNELAMAPPDAIAEGMRVTFLVAALLVLVALALAAGSRRRTG